MTIGVQFIERKRTEHVTQEAQKLFDVIVEATVAMMPTETYELDVSWKRQAVVIDTMVLERTEDLFKEMNSELVAVRKDDKTVRVKLTPSSKLEEELTPVELFWSRAPGKFVNKQTGKPIVLSNSMSVGPQFTGTVREWYETLVETCIDAASQLQKIIGEAPTALYVGHDVMCVLESSVLYRPKFNVGERGVEAGTLCNRFNVRIDPTLTTTLKMIGIKDGKRHVAVVNVLDMNII